MEDLKFAAIATDLNSDSRAVKLDMLKMLFRVDLIQIEEIEDLLLLLLDILYSSSDEELVYYARQVFHKILNLKNIDYNYFFHPDGRLVISKAIICIKDAKAGEVIAFLSYLSRQKVENLENDRLYIFLCERLERESKLLAIIFILKILPSFPRKYAESAEILGKFLHNKNPFIVATAIEGLGVLKNEDQVTLIARFLTEQKKILAATAMKALLEIDPDFALMEVRKISLMDASDVKSRVCFLIDYLPGGKKSFKFILGLLFDQRYSKYSRRIIDTIIHKLDSVNYNYLLEIMAELRIENSQLQTYTKIVESIRDRFGIDTETLELLKKVNIREKKEAAASPVTRTSTVSEKASGLRSKPAAAESKGPQPIEKVKVLHRYATVLIILLVLAAGVILNYNTDRDSQNTVEFVVSEKPVEEARPAASPTEVKKFEKRNKEGNFSRNPRQTRVLEGKVTHVAQSGFSGIPVCIVETDDSRYRVELSENCRNEPIKEGDFIKMKGIVSKTDAIGIIYFYCLKMF